MRPEKHLFYSYAREDEELRDELEKHLTTLKREGTISSWHDRQILPGQHWDEEIAEELNRADVILLLLSPDFIASDYICDKELKIALRRRRAGKAVVIPIALRPVAWPKDLTKIQGLPKDCKPVTTWPNRDEAFLDIEAGIRRIAGSRPWWKKWQVQASSIFVAVMVAALSPEIIPSIRGLFAPPEVIVTASADGEPMMIEVHPGDFDSGDCDTPQEEPGSGKDLILPPCDDAVLINLPEDDRSLWNFVAEFQVVITSGLTDVTWVARAQDRASYYRFTLKLPQDGHKGRVEGVVVKNGKVQNSFISCAGNVFDSTGTLDMTKTVPAGHILFVNIFARGARVNHRILLEVGPPFHVKHPAVGHEQDSSCTIDGNPYEWGQIGFISNQGLEFQTVSYGGLAK